MRFITVYSTYLLVILSSCNIFGYYHNTNYNSPRLGTAALDMTAIYEGVMQPENIIVGVIQNFINFLTSTIGWVFILPFYQVC